MYQKSITKVKQYQISEKPKVRKYQRLERSKEPKDWSLLIDNLSIEFYILCAMNSIKARLTIDRSETKSLEPRHCRRGTNSRQGWHLAGTFTAWQSAGNSVRGRFQLRNGRAFWWSLSDASGLYKKRRWNILCLSWLRAITWRGRCVIVECHRINVCVIAPVCGLQNFVRNHATHTVAFFFVIAIDVIAQRYLHFLQADKYATFASFLHQLKLLNAF